MFFLALLPQESLVEFSAWASDHLAGQRPELSRRLEPAMLGLKRAIEGLPAETPPNADGTAGARRFLGWTTGRHWLIAPE